MKQDNEPTMITNELNYLRAQNGFIEEAIGTGRVDDELWQSFIDENNARIAELERKTNKQLTLF